MTTDREQRRLAEKGDSKYILLSPEPSCPNPHIVTKSLRQNQWQNCCNEIVGLRSVDLARENYYISKFYGASILGYQDIPPKPSLYF